MGQIVVHTITTEEELGFSSVKYSRFKHGDKRVCEDFSSSLSEKIIQSLHNTFTEKIQVKGSCKVAIFGAPYNKVKTASSYLAEMVTRKLNSYYRGTSCEFAELKIYRQHSYQQDYSAMSLEGREESLSAETYEFIPAVEYINETFDYAIFIDDILITGAHERRIQDLISRKGITIPHSFAYFAYLQQGCCEPQIEDRLNNAAFAWEDPEGSFQKHVYEMISKGVFLPNTRVMKRILSLEKHYIELCKRLDVFQLGTLKKYAELNKYHTHSEYRMNYEILSHNYFIKHAELREK